MFNVLMAIAVLFMGVVVGAVVLILREQKRSER